MSVVSVRYSILKMTSVLPIFLWLSACVTTPKYEVPWGVQKGHRGFVPARIALLSCQPWPNGARMETIPLSNIPPKESADLCVKFDEFIVNGFQNQPFMRGFTPKAVGKLLDQAGKANLVDRLPNLWSHELGDCSECPHAPSFYVNSISGRPGWRQWLNELSVSARNADAVLLPFLVYGAEQRFNDRGMRIAERSAAAVMLLLDTNNGDLLWAGGRDAKLVNQKLENESTPDPLPMLPWIDLSGRLFINALWKEFPGHQDYE